MLFIQTVVLCVVRFALIYANPRRRDLLPQGLKKLPDFGLFDRPNAVSISRTRTAQESFCRPNDGNPNAASGVCVPTSLLNLRCVDHQVAFSADCSGLLDGERALCCYNESPTKFRSSVKDSASSYDYMTTGQPDPLTSTATPSPTPDMGEYINSQKAVVREHQCGVPNGDPNLFIDYERLKTKQTFRRVRLRPPTDDPSEKRHRNGNRRKIHIAQTIVGGFEAPNGSGSLCWQVSLQLIDLRVNVSYSCGGSIIGMWTILTASHCLIDTTVADFQNTDYAVYVSIGVITRSATDFTNLYPDTVLDCARTYRVAQSIPHPNFTLDTFNNDVALLILSEPIDFRFHGACACKICLSTTIPQPGDKCVTSGWGGEMNSEFVNATAFRDIIPLKYVLQTILTPSYDTCGYFESVSGERTDLDQFLCAGGVVGEDACQGDSGGPLFCYNATTRRQYLGGMVSSGEGCATGVGALYTKVGRFLPWIFNTAPLGDLTINV